MLKNHGKTVDFCSEIRVLFPTFEAMPALRGFFTDFGPFWPLSYSPVYWESLTEFIQRGDTYKGGYPACDIYDDFTITYSSGSTKIGCPKAIVHATLHYLIMARFHDEDLSGMPSMKGMRGLAIIPTSSNTNIAACISDVLSQRGTVAFEPIYNMRSYAYSLIINRPGFSINSTTLLMGALKQFETDPLLKDKKLPFLTVIGAVGEGMLPNEAEFINKKLAQLGAGRDVLPWPVSPVKLSVGGGDCEHGGIFFSLFKTLKDRLKGCDTGMIPFRHAEIAALRLDGTECDFEEYGKIVANSPCTMKRYNNDSRSTEEFYVTDAYGRRWGNCNVWGLIRRNGNVVVRGRYDSAVKLQSGKLLPLFLIEDTIASDRKRIISCEVIQPAAEKYRGLLVAEIEIKPAEDKNWGKILLAAERRCRDEYCSEIADRIVYMLRPHDRPFELTASGKRNVRALELEELGENCCKPNIDTGDFVRADEYISLRERSGG